MGATLLRWQWIPSGLRVVWRCVRAMRCDSCAAPRACTTHLTSHVTRLTSHVTHHATHVTRYASRNMLPGCSRGRGVQYQSDCAVRIAGLLQGQAARKVLFERRRRISAQEVVSRSRLFCDVYLVNALYRFSLWRIMGVVQWGIGCRLF